MLRTIRAAVAVMLLGGIGLTVPPQTRDMLAFLEDDRIWPPISFQLALIVLAGSAWFWSRAALAARFGIDDNPQNRPPAPDFDWPAYTWLPRLIFAAGSPLARLLRRRLVGRASRSAFSLGPALTGAAAGALFNRRETRKLGREIQRDLRRRAVEPPHGPWWHR